jgi:glycosyltransferase involved in cell wall biosynthesis
MLQQDDNVPARKIVVIRNFLDDTAFATTGDQDIRQRRESWGLPPDAFVIGIIGRLHAVKNHAMLLQALAQSHQDCHAVLVGDGPTRSELQQLATKLGIAGRVHFRGETLEGNLHRYFDISVLTSTSEGSPNSIIEALAAARPVVATAVGGVVDIIDHERTGLLIPSGDAPALSVAIERLRVNTCLREQLGAAGLEIMRQRHCRATVMTELSALYTSLAHRAS